MSVLEKYDSERIEFEREQGRELVKTVLVALVGGIYVGTLITGAWMLQAPPENFVTEIMAPITLGALGLAIIAYLVYRIAENRLLEYAARRGYLEPAETQL